MDLSGYLLLLRRNWFIMIIGALLGLLVGLLYAGMQRPMFSATAAVVVATGQSADVNDLNASTTFAQQAVKTYATVLQSPLVLDPVIKDLHLDTTPAALSASVTSSIPLDTTVLSISVQNPSAEDAARIANAVAASLSKAVTTISPATTRTADVVITTIQPATVPGAPVSPKVPVDAGLGLIVGIALAIAVIALREALGVRVRDERDVVSLTDRPVIGRILFDRTLRERPLVMRNDPFSAMAESFRTLRTAVHFLDLDETSRSFVVTSAVKGEGKSICAANLALAIGDARRTVVVVDADLRQPRLGAYFGIDSSVGLTDVLVGDVALQDALQVLDDGYTAVLPAGQLPPNPAELVQSRAMERLLEELTTTFSTVIIDGPPLLPVSDSGVLARRTGGALLVASAGRVTRPQLRAALASLDSLGARVLGLAITMLPSRGTPTYGYDRRSAAVPARPAPE